MLFYEVFAFLATKNELRSGQVVDKSGVDVEEALRQTLLASKQEKQVQDQS